MHKLSLRQPVVLYLYGIPGSGKTLVSMQIANMLGMAHVSAERIREELFEDPRHDKTEMQIILQLMNLMTETLLKAGVSVVYDVSLSRFNDRKTLRELAKKFRAQDLMVWLQVDPETAWLRANKRDPKKPENKYASKLTLEQFKQYIKIMQAPHNEEYLVLSGKHQFNSHKQLILKKFSDMGVLNIDSAQQRIAKPELVNLVSKAQAQAGRVDYTRRNISIQ